ncbi:histone deacetylase family protein [Lutibaculum baratangense]|uniref:Acetylspermidine deacetylase n=1 Tax=Lutibaculum baratangense AMV1 TaxID=631454 RepID=V4RF24_9HYPH|nr:histone deacetylase family protein [Lutibaculum baratangense]ESR24751.1 Acetylspermidine deacetylase [Lutibaculum baratangense AMV1]
MPTLLISHPASLGHLVPEGHPERPDRMRAIDRALEAEEFQSLLREVAPLAPIDAALLAHPEDYVRAIEAAAPGEGEDLVGVDADTVMSSGSLEAVMRGVGAAMLAVDEVVAGNVSNAFCCTRPPGHHAERRRAMGFCIFNQAAIAAIHAQKAHGLKRVAVMDFDVHHGNGTQDIFWNHEDLFYASTHQMPLYPGTGAARETGAAGNIVNAPLAPGSGGREFREAMEGIVLPALDEFSPELLIISAGFDAHRRDPLASLNFVEEDFAWGTRKLMEVADRSCGGRVVSVLEGGYDLMGLALSTAAHVRTLMTR